MKKLLKLKEWLTLPDAARHLSLVFEEEVTEADLLRFALDGHLQLSVRFVNSATARPGKLVSLREAKCEVVPSLVGEGEVHLYRGPVLSSNGAETDVIELEDSLLQLEGVYDLPLYGSERLDIEHAYQQLTGGPSVTSVGLDGAFVVGRSGSVFQLQESYENNQFKAGSKASLEKIKAHIHANGLSPEEADSLLMRHREDRTKYLDERKLRPAVEDYYPTSLPDDAVWVVRTEALRRLEESVDDESAKDRKLSTTERNTLLKLVIGMAIDGYGYNPKSLRSDVPKRISDDLATNEIYVSDDTIRRWLKAASEVL